MSDLHKYTNFGGWSKLLLMMEGDKELDVPGRKVLFPSLGSFMMEGDTELAVPGRKVLFPPLGLLVMEGDTELAVPGRKVLFLPRTHPARGDGPEKIDSSSSS